MGPLSISDRSGSRVLETSVDLRTGHDTELSWFAGFTFFEVVLTLRGPVGPRNTCGVGSSLAQ